MPGHGRGTPRPLLPELRRLNDAILDIRHHELADAQRTATGRGDLTFADPTGNTATIHTPRTDHWRRRARDLAADIEKELAGQGPRIRRRCTGTNGCGRTVPEKAAYCPSCGNQLTADGDGAQAC